MTLNLYAPVEQVKADRERAELEGDIEITEVQPVTEETPTGFVDDASVTSTNNNTPITNTESSASAQSEEVVPIGNGVFGDIFDQFRGKPKEAIAFLLDKKDGEAIGALHHHDIGDIDIVWGEEGTGKSDGFGLAKLAKYHSEVLNNLQELLDDMDIVQESDNRIKLESDTHFAVVSKEYKGEPRGNWLLTAYEKKETSEPANSRMDVESNLKGKSDDTATRQDSDVSADKVTNKSEITNTSDEKVNTQKEKSAEDNNYSEEYKELQSLAQKIKEHWEKFAKITDDKEEDEFDKALIPIRQRVKQLLPKLSDEELSKLQEEENLELYVSVEINKREAERTSRVTFDEISKSQSIEQKNVKKGSVKMTDFTSNDDMRPVMNGVYHNEGDIVASDGHILIVKKGDYDKALEGKVTIDEKRAKRVINTYRAEKIGNEYVIEGKYPNYHMVIPNEANCVRTDVDVTDMRKFLAGAVEQIRTQWKNGKENKKIRDSFDTYLHYHSVLIKMSDGRVVAYKVHNMSKLLDAMDELGMTSLYVDNRDAVMAKNDKGTVLAMPVYIGEYTDNTFLFAYDTTNGKSSEIEKQSTDKDADSKSLLDRFNAMQSKIRELKNNAKDLLGELTKENYDKADEETKAKFDDIKKEMQGVAKSMTEDELIKLAMYNSRELKKAEDEYQKWLDEHDTDNLTKEEKAIGKGLGERLEKTANFDKEINIVLRDYLGSDKIVVAGSVIKYEGDNKPNSKTTETTPTMPTINESSVTSAEGAEVKREELQTVLEDKQGNPIDRNGKLIIEKVDNIDEISDEDFNNPKRSVQLPTLPKNVSDAIGSEGKPVIIKKNIFEKNRESHKFTPVSSRTILKSALYNTDLIGQTQPLKKPFYWVAIKRDEKNPIAILEVNEDKENTEIVGWYTLDERNLERIKRQADKNDGELIILSPKDKVESLSTPPADLSSAGKGTNNLENTKTTTDKIEDVGEKILGARKDMYREMAKSFEDVTEKSLVELPFAKAFKKPNLAKAVETGVLREKDAMFYETFFNTLINTQKPKLSRRMISLKARFPETETAIDTWAKQTHSTLEALGKFIGMDEAQRDAFIEEMTKEHFPNREQELAEIQARKTRNRNYYREKTDEEYDSMWGTDTTPNPIWVTSEVLNRLGYKVGDKVDLPFSTIKANSGGKGYMLTNKKGEYLLRFGSVDTIEEAIDDIVYLAKLKRGDYDIQHPITSFDIFPTKHDREETGEYEVYNNRRYVGKFNKEDADKYVESHKHSYAMPITRATRYYDYKISFRNALTGDKTEVSDKMFDTKDEARAYLEENYDEINENINNILAKEAGRGKKEVTDDDLLDIKLVSSDGKKWDYAVVVNEKYANNMGMPYEIKGGFENRKDAKEYLESIKDNVFKVYSDNKEQGKAFVYFDTGEDSRIGTDYRNGKDVTADDFMNAFGFRGVQFGNWTNQADRQMAVNQAYDAFMDLANLIGVSPKAISLNGELGIAFGARGSGSFNAHYEPGEVVINLTKTRGAGSLAHEWWHALDNYFSRQNGVAGGMVTKNPNLVERAELQQAYKSLMDMVLKSDYAKRSRARGDYWGRPEEITARLLAEWVDQELKNKGEVNTFLSRGANTEKWQKRAYKAYQAYQEILGEKPMSFDEYKQTPESLMGYPYPTAKEVSEFSDAMRNIFTTIQERETDNGMIALFQKALSEPYTENTTEAQRLATETAMQMLNDNTNLNVHIVSDEEVQRMAESGDAELMAVNDKFNEDIDAFVKGKLKSSVIFNLGKPNSLLKACGLNDSEITMNQSVLRNHLEKHSIGYDEIKNLVNAIQTPLMVYEWGKDKGKSTIVITQIEHGKEKITVAVKLERGGKHLEVNEIASIHSKSVQRLISEMNTDKSEFDKDNLKYVNKEKTLEWVAMEAPLASSQPNKGLISATKVIEDFENPKISEEKNANIPEFLKKPDGTIYGYTIGKDIYLTKEGINPNSPIHEYSHVWCTAVQENNPELWESVKSLIKDTPIYDEVMSDKAYENIHGNFDLRSVCTNFDCVELTTAEMLTYLCLRRIGLDP